MIENFTNVVENFDPIRRNWAWDNPRRNFNGIFIAQPQTKTQAHNIMKYLSLGSKMKVFILMFALIVLPSFTVFGYCYYKDYYRKKIIRQEQIDKDEEQNIAFPRKTRYGNDSPYKFKVFIK